METTWAVLASLFQFRIATAEQRRRLHAPGGGIGKTRGRLRRSGRAAHVPTSSGSSGRHPW
ncbi:hypothetical protein OG535_00545 [Kitasatospora sp. NBC_00085]|uniref:hypothetical protein n=1 Tax=unclassified Kitasatospora TaxID=2633591 RepID=UPI00324F3576